MNNAEAFAAVALAAVACDGSLGRDEAHALRAQLEHRSLYANSSEAAMGDLFDALLSQLRDKGVMSLVEAALPVLNTVQQQSALAVACHLVHADRTVTEQESAFLAALADQMALPEGEAKMSSGDRSAEPRQSRRLTADWACVVWARLMFSLRRLVSALISLCLLTAVAVPPAALAIAPSALGPDLPDERVLDEADVFSRASRSELSGRLEDLAADRVDARVVTLRRLDYGLTLDRFGEDLIEAWSPKASELLLLLLIETQRGLLSRPIQPCNRNCRLRCLPARHAPR